MVIQSPPLNQSLDEFNMSFLCSKFQQFSITRFKIRPGFYQIVCDFGVTFLNSIM